MRDLVGEKNTTSAKKRRKITSVLSLALLAFFYASFAFLVGNALSSGFNSLIAYPVSFLSFAIVFYVGALFFYPKEIMRVQSRLFVELRRRGLLEFQLRPNAFDDEPQSRVFSRRPVSRENPERERTPFGESV